MTMLLQFVQYDFQGSGYQQITTNKGFCSLHMPLQLNQLQLNGIKYTLFYRVHVVLKKTDSSGLKY